MLKVIKIALLATVVASVSSFANVTHSPKNINYTLAIKTPANEQAYQRPAQSVEMAVEVSPKLDPLDTLVLKVNGEIVAYNQYQFSFASVDYNPGELVLSAEVQNEAGRTIANDEKKIYLIQNTALMRAKRQAKAEQAAFDALPWYQKIGKTRPAEPSTLTAPRVLK